MSTPAAGRLAHWLARLEQLDPSKIELGLERVTQVLPRLDLKQPRLTLTIAGTNGKGTCAQMLSHLLVANGLRVGRYTSPHLQHFNERVAIDDVAADDDALVAAFERIDAARGHVHLTYFEFTTLAALVIFATRQVDVQVLEVGLGGRLDAVNAVEPDGCLLTNIALDHQRWLGDTLELIGAEKAAVFRRETPAIVATPAPPESVLATARGVGANLLVRDKHFRANVSGDGASWRWQGVARAIDGLPWMDAAQTANAAGVLTLLEAVGQLSGLDDATCRAAAVFRPAGRIERIASSPAIVLDVCHNEDSVMRLAQWLEHSAVLPQSRTIVFGAMRDKAIAEMLAPLAPYATRWVAVAAPGGRAMPSDALAQQISAMSGAAALAAGSPWQGMQHARRVTPEAGEIIVAGSFPVVGAIRSRL
ncbi:MAG: Mur ligase family protein [Pseudomonadota bacterium]